MKIPQTRMFEQLVFHTSANFKLQQCSMHLKCFIVAFELNIRKIPLIDLDAKSYIVLKDIIGKTLHKNQGKDAQTSLSTKHYILLSS